MAFFKYHFLRNFEITYKTLFKLVFTEKLLILGNTKHREVPNSNLFSTVPFLRQKSKGLSAVAAIHANLALVSLCSDSI